MRVFPPETDGRRKIAGGKKGLFRFFLFGKKVKGAHGKELCRDDGDGGIMHYGMIHIREKMEAGRVWWGEGRK